MTTTTKRKLKVYGWAGFARGVPGRQQRVIVAARSLAEVRRLCDASQSVGWPGRDYICDSGNEAELALALPRPSVFFAQPLNPIDGREWVEVPSKVGVRRCPTKSWTGTSECQLPEGHEGSHRFDVIGLAWKPGAR